MKKMLAQADAEVKYEEDKGPWPGPVWTWGAAMDREEVGEQQGDGNSRRGSISSINKTTIRAAGTEEPYTGRNQTKVRKDDTSNYFYILDN